MQFSEGYQVKKRSEMRVMFCEETKACRSQAMEPQHFKLPDEPTSRHCLDSAARHRQNFTIKTHQSDDGKITTTNCDSIYLAIIILRSYLNCITPFRRSVQLKAGQSTFQRSNRGVSFTHCSISAPWGPAQRRKRRSRRTSRYALLSLNKMDCS
jgi:hypothetical protein